jgi:AraC-like DNA-binding protein
VTEICFDVGFSSLGTFCRTFRAIVGCSASEYRARSAPLRVPGCMAMALDRPSGTFGEVAEPRRA